MGLLDGRVAFITGAARAQGRSHAVRLANEGADIIAVDICASPAATGYPAATPDDLDETVRQVEATGRRIVHRIADVRDQAALDEAVTAGVAAFGRLDVVVANAGISTWGRFWEMDEQRWQDMIDINLTGVWRTMRSATPAMIEAGNGGSTILISSTAGIKSLPGQAHYSSAKHGVVGLAKSAAIELAEYKIRVNTIHPWGVNTPMTEDHEYMELFGKFPSYMASFASITTDPQIAEPADVSDAVLFLASDMSRTMTAAQFTIDMGATKV